MAGKYKTKQQSAIKECLEMHKDGYVTVMDIENYLKENDCQVGLTTIYRHLEKMEKDGIVTKFSVEGQPGACFQYIEQGENQDCFYIKCEECGEVTKMECHHLAELYSHVNADHHFSINPKKTIFYGKCEKCGKCEKSHGPGRNLYRSRGYRRKLCPYHAFRSCNRRCDRAYSGTTGTPSIARAFIYGGVTIGDMPVYRKKERRSWQSGFIFMRIQIPRV